MAADLAPRVARLLEAEEDAKGDLIDRLVRELMAVLGLATGEKKGKAEYERAVKLVNAAARAQRNTTKKWAETTLKQLGVKVRTETLPDLGDKVYRTVVYDAWQEATKEGTGDPEGVVRTMVGKALAGAQARTREDVFDRYDDDIHGYRRVVHPEMSKGGACGLCVVASTRVYWIPNLRPIHDGCHCGVVPIVGDQDPGGFINDDDLGDAYAANGGKTNGWDLKRLRYNAEGRLVDGDGNEPERAPRPDPVPEKDPEVNAVAAMDAELVEPEVRVEKALPKWQKVAPNLSAAAIKWPGNQRPTEDHTGQQLRDTGWDNWIRPTSRDANLALGRYIDYAVASDVNEALRAKRELTGELKQLVTDLDAGMNLSIRGTATVYRGVSVEGWLDDPQVGHVIRDGGYISTSSGMGLAQRYLEMVDPEGWVMEIQVGEDVRFGLGMWDPAGQFEAILARETELHIVGVDAAKQVLRVVARGAAG